MNPAPVLILSLALAPATLLAQSTSNPGTSGMENLDTKGQNTATTTKPPTECPIKLRAQHLSDGDLVKTGIAHPKGVGQALHVTVAPSSHGMVTQADVLLYGWTPKGRFSQTATGPNSTVTRPQHVWFTPGKDESTADIWVAGLSAITSIEISSATYSDGTIWKSSANLSCSTKPELLMLVSP